MIRGPGYTSHVGEMHSNAGRRTPIRLSPLEQRSRPRSRETSAWLYDARTAVKRELVPRLASLLWRMRRATAIETDLLQIQAEILSDGLHEYKTGDDTEANPQSIAYRVLQRAIGPSLRRPSGNLKACCPERLRRWVQLAVFRRSDDTMERRRSRNFAPGNR